MQCTEIREQLLELATGEPAASGVQEHLRACQDCAAELASLQSTMALLDEWKAPEDTSPYFMTRLRARIREEAQTEAARASGWLSWFRKPALALTMAALLLASISLFRSSDTKPNPPAQVSRVSSPVNDLQYLDENKDVLANFELLDADQNNQSVSQ